MSHSKLAAWIRLWLLQRPGVALRASAWTCAGYAAVSLALWTGFVWWQALPSPQFVADAVPLFAWYGLAALGMAALMRGLSRPSPRFDDALGLVLGLAPLPVLFATVGWSYLETAWLLGAGLLGLCYAQVYLARGLRAFTGASQRWAALTGLAFVASFIWLSDSLAVVPALFEPLEASAPLASADEAPADEEAILFAQPGRIDRLLATMHPDEGGAPRAFFLGFAGVGDEKVFTQEISLAARALGERYAIGGNSLSLINDERDLESAPLASVSSLSYALQGLAAKMDRKRDVLFLAISSHGAQDPAVIVANSGLPLNDLTPHDLAQALQTSGIERRVIIISACFAGGFIDELEGPGSIVITAAAADRTSFGCGSDSDLTYFGEAFYRDSLPDAASLHEAFDRAKSVIGVRERREHVDPSKPQAFFDPQLEATLKSMISPRR